MKEADMFSLTTGLTPYVGFALKELESSSKEE